MLIVEKIINSGFTRSKTLSKLFVLLKVALFFLLCFGIYTQLNRYKTADWYTYFAGVNGLRLTIGILTVVLLMIFNWGLETLKWHTLINKVEKQNFSSSAKAILSSVALGFNTPNRIGEFGGRLLFVKKENVYKAIGLTTIGNMMQISVTLILGSLSLMAYSAIFQHPILPANLVIIIMTILSVLTLTFIFSWKKWIPSSKKNRINEFIKSITGWKPILYVKIFYLSLLRYLVYTSQFILLLDIFGIEVAKWKSALAVSSMYFFQTISPTISLLDLGVRQNLAYFVFQPISTELMGITLATFMIWLINLTVPAIVGYGIILKTKFF